MCDECAHNTGHVPEFTHNAQSRVNTSMCQYWWWKHMYTLYGSVLGDEKIKKL